MAYNQQFPANWLEETDQAGCSVRLGFGRPYILIYASKKIMIRKWPNGKIF